MLPSRNGGNSARARSVGRGVADGRKEHGRIPAAHTTAAAVCGGRQAAAAAAARAQGRAEPKPARPRRRLRTGSVPSCRAAHAPRRGIGFACRQKASRGQRADMPTAPPPSPTATAMPACCRHGDFPWSRILTEGAAAECTSPTRTHAAPAPHRTARAAAAGPPPTARIFIGSGHLSFVLRYTARTRLRQRPRNATASFSEPAGPPGSPPTPPLRSSRVRPLRARPDQAKLIGRTNGAATPKTLRLRLRQKKPEQARASSDVDQLDQLRRGFPGRVRPRLRRHRAHPRPPGLLLRRRSRRRRPQARPRRPRHAALPKGAGRGVAAGAREPAQRAARRASQARQGGRGRRAVPAQGGPRGARRVRGPSPRAPRHVRLLPRSRRGREARRRRHRRRVRAHLRGQGRRLDARRRRPLQDVRGLMQEDPPHEELRGRQPISKDIIPMIVVVDAYASFV